MSSEAHNQLYGPPLIVQVMDRIRECHGTGERLTLWGLRKHICDKHKVTGDEQELVYARIRTVLKNLRNGGMVRTEKDRDEKDNPHIIIHYVTP